MSNLYPFSSDPSIELIDIGGPSMVRAAAKNHEHVGVAHRVPSQYDAVLDELVATGDAVGRDAPRAWRARPSPTPRPTTRRSSRGSTAAGPSARRRPTPTRSCPRRCTSRSSARSVVRYGENPHQIGARYRVAGTTPWWDGVIQHAGSALSYLNLFDADAAWRLVHELAIDVPGLCAVAIIKHANASGAAVGATFADAFQKALDADPRAPSAGSSRVGGELDAALATRHRRRSPGRRHHRVVDRTPTRSTSS